MVGEYTVMGTPNCLSLISWLKSDRRLENYSRYKWLVMNVVALNDEEYLVEYNTALPCRFSLCSNLTVTFVFDFMVCFFGYA